MVKPIEELTIADDFMFGAVMRNPRLCKRLLELILGVEIRRVEYPESQKTIAERYGSKSIRLDVYVEDDAGAVYDVEIQTTNEKNLPKRARYYQGLIDLNILEKGEEYQKLRKSFVIFICTFDPFEKGLWVYTFENLCREEPALALDDGAVKIVLNTKGYAGEIDGELKALLRYVDGFAPESGYTKELDSAVADVRADGKWRIEYMRFYEVLMDSKRLGGYKEMIGRLRELRTKFDEQVLVAFCYDNPELLQTIYDTIDANPDWDDEQVAEHVFY